jgi:carbonic anhydrase
MDARLDPAKYAGLAEGDAHVIRNAGGIVTDDALRSLVISHWLLGTREAIVVGHTDCGMETFTDDALREKLATEAGADASDVDFHAFPAVRDRVRESVRRINETPLLPDSFTASGFVYDVTTGRLEPVE